MTLTTAIMLNVAFDLAMLGALAFVCSRASKLTAHDPELVSGVPVNWRVERRHHAHLRPALPAWRRAQGRPAYSVR